MEKRNNSDYLLVFKNSLINTAVLPNDIEENKLQNNLTNILTQNLRTNVNVSNKIADFEEIIPYSLLPNTKSNNEEMEILSQPNLHIVKQYFPLYSNIDSESENIIHEDDEIVIHTKIPSSIGMIENTRNDCAFSNSDDDFVDEEIILHTEIPRDAEMIVNRDLSLEISYDNVVELITNTNTQILNHKVLVGYDEDGIITDKNKENNWRTSDDVIEINDSDDERRDVGTEPIPNFEESLRTKKEHLIKKLRIATNAESKVRTRRTKVNSTKTSKEKVYEKLHGTKQVDLNKVQCYTTDPITWMRQCKKRKKIWAGLDMPLRGEKHRKSSIQNPIEMAVSKTIPSLQRKKRNGSQNTNLITEHLRQTKPGSTKEEYFEEEDNFVVCD